MTEVTEAPKLTAAERMAHARAARKSNSDTLAPEMAAFEPAPIAPSTVPVGLAVSAPADAAFDRASQQRAAAEAAAEPVPEVDSPSNNTRVANKIAAEDAARARAARQRLAAGLAPPQPTVQVRITRLGDGKVSMGEHVGGVGEVHFEWKEETSLPQDIALALEERALVEIL